MSWLENNPISAGFIGSGIQSASSLGAGIFNYLAQRETNKTNRELAELSYQQNIEQWERENAYNHPAQQMQRLTEAGLNPNLVYGNGSAVQTSAHSPQMSYPQMQAPNLEFQFSNFISDALNAKLKVSEIQNVEADTAGKNTANAIAALDLAMAKIREAGYQDYYDLMVDELKSRRDLNNSTKDLNDSNIDLNKSRKEELDAAKEERIQAAEEKKRNNEFWNSHPELFGLKQILDVVEPLLPGVTEFFRFVFGRRKNKNSNSSKKGRDSYDGEGNWNGVSFYLEE